MHGKIPSKRFSNEQHTFLSEIEALTIGMTGKMLKAFDENIIIQDDNTKSDLRREGGRLPENQLNLFRHDHIANIAVPSRSMGIDKQNKDV